MPVGTLKNKVYHLALPVLGLRSPISVSDKTGEERAVAAILRKRRALGACVQRFEKGRLSACYALGLARRGGEEIPVEKETLFRTASIAKMVSALLVFRLQTLGKLNVCEELSDFLGYPVQNPAFPNAPVTLAMLLNHTSSLQDGAAYYASVSQPAPLSALLKDSSSFSASLPGLEFRYSNFAAGIVGCLLEARFHQSFERLAQETLFEPLGVKATFDPSRLQGEPVADGWRVLPQKRRFDAARRIASSSPMEEPDPERRYFSAAGNLYLSAEDLSRLALVCWNGRDGFLSPECLSLLQTPTVSWPEPPVRLRHGMGLLRLEDAAVCSKPLWGHQGFAYGAVNGVFFDEEGNGFCCLDSGVSEERNGHLALVNQDLIQLFWPRNNEKEPAHA